MDDRTLNLFEWQRNNDYTGAVCWLIWKPKLGAFDTRQALVDIEDFERLKHHSWKIQKIGKNRKLRLVRSTGIYLAREIMGFPQGMIVDHWDRDSLNDRRGNLRSCTTRENSLNSPGSSRGTSKYKGVAWASKQKKWKVITGTKKNKVYVGSFDTEEAAARLQ